MPTYEYICRSCGHRFDVVQSMTEPPLAVCPECGGELRKVFTPPAISFKGSGFYRTDHAAKTRSEGEAAASSEPKKGADAKPSGGGSKTSDKPVDGVSKRADKKMDKKKESAPSEG